MIKKILCAFLVCLISINSYANIHIDPKLVLTVVKNHIPDENVRAKVLKVYKAELNNNTPKNSLSAASISKMCDAAGWNRTKDSKKRGNFRKDLIIRSYYTYYEVCGKDRNDKDPNKRCDETIFAKTQVTKSEADLLIKKYVVRKYNDEIQCSINFRTYNNDDYMKCTSKFAPVYYEFKFDDLTENNRQTVRENLQKAICKVYSLEYEPAVDTHYGLNGLKEAFTEKSVKLHNAYCKTQNTDLCKKIASFAKGFGYDVHLDIYKWCAFHQDKNACSFKDLRTAYNINNQIFYENDVARQSSRELIESEIKSYVIKTIKPKQLATFSCDRGAKEFSCKDVTEKAVFLTCYVNKQPVDFIFKSLSASAVSERAGAQKTKCFIKGGEYVGGDCLNLSEEQCSQIGKEFNKKYNIPSATMMVNGRCKLGATVTEDMLNYVGDMFGLALGVADCAVGSHTVGCALAITNAVALRTKVQTGFIGDQRLKKFLEVAGKCYERKCAIETIKEASRVLSLLDMFDDTEVTKIDGHLSRLVGYLKPEDVSLDAKGWDDVIQQLGGDPNDRSGKAISALYKVAGFVQTGVSIISGLRLTHKALSSLVNIAKNSYGIADILDAKDATAAVVETVEPLAPKTGW